MQHNKNECVYELTNQKYSHCFLTMGVYHRTFLLTYETNVHRYIVCYTCPKRLPITIDGLNENNPPNHSAAPIYSFGEYRDKLREQIYYGQTQSYINCRV